jgi:hypothetical protein
MLASVHQGPPPSATSPNTTGRPPVNGPGSGRMRQELRQAPCVIAGRAEHSRATHTERRGPYKFGSWQTRRISVWAGGRGDAQISHGIVISAGARSCRRPVAAAGGQCLPELAAGGDSELGDDLGQVVLDGARAEEQLGGDLRVRQGRPDQLRDLGLLGVSWSSASAVRLRTVSPVARSSWRVRSANACMPIVANMSCAVRSCARASARRPSRAATRRGAGAPGPVRAASRFGSLRGPFLRR